MWEAPLQIEHSKVDGYTHYNYALLHGNGVAEIFNVLRYNNCFLCRRTDLSMLLEAAKDYTNWTLRQYAILLCRYDWAGPTKAHWAHDMLLSDQRFEECSDLSQLFELGSAMEKLRAKPKLQWKHEIELTGSLGWVLEVMYLNRAFPNHEADASRISQAFWGDEEITVGLANYMAVKVDKWQLPQK